MKKALIVLLLLAVAGGLFALDWTFGGMVNSGLAFAKYADVDESVVGLNAKASDAPKGLRGRLFIDVTNDDGDAGFSAMLQHDRITGSSWFDTGRFNFRYINGWFNAFDGLLKVEGGKFWGSDYGVFDTSLDWLQGGWFDNTGLRVQISPVDMFKIAVGTYSNQAFGAAEAPDLHYMTGWLGLYAGLPDLFDLNAQLVSVHPEFDNGDDSGTHALLSVAVKAVPGINIMASGIFYTLNEFSDAGRMWFAEEVGINIIDNLSLNLSITESMSNVEGKDDMFIRAWFWLTYGLGGIIPRLDVNYVMAGTGFESVNGGLHPNGVGLGANYNKDYAFLEISPSVKFIVNANATFELGYMFGMDMSKNDLAAIGVKNGGINHAAFLDLRYSF